MNPTKTPYFWEIQAVQLRYDEYLLREEIAERQELSFNQVKHLFSKANVKWYIHNEILPILWRNEIAELEEKLRSHESRIEAHADFVIAETKAKSCLWLGGKRVFVHTARSNRRRMQALNKIGQVFDLFDPSHSERNCRRNVLKFAAKLSERLELLKEKLRAAEEAAEREKEKS